jgi:hypothetical protein
MKKEIETKKISSFLSCLFPLPFQCKYSHSQRNFVSFSTGFISSIINSCELVSGRNTISRVLNGNLFYISLKLNFHLILNASLKPYNKYVLERFEFFTAVTIKNCVVPSSPILVTLIKEALSSSDTSVLTTAIWQNIP